MTGLVKPEMYSNPTKTHMHPRKAAFCLTGPSSHLSSVATAAEEIARGRWDFETIKRKLQRYSGKCAAMSPKTRGESVEVFMLSEDIQRLSSALSALQHTTIRTTHTPPPPPTPWHSATDTHTHPLKSSSDEAYLGITSDITSQQQSMLDGVMVMLQDIHVVIDKLEDMRQNNRCATLPAARPANRR